MISKPNLTKCPKLQRSWRSCREPLQRGPNMPTWYENTCSIVSKATTFRLPGVTPSFDFELVGCYRGPITWDLYTTILSRSLFCLGYLLQPTRIKGRSRAQRSPRIGLRSAGQGLRDGVSTAAASVGHRAGDQKFCGGGGISFIPTCIPIQTGTLNTDVTS